MIKASDMLHFLCKNNIVIDSNVEEELRFNDAISYSNLLEITEELMLVVEDLKQEAYEEPEEAEQQIEAQQLEIESLRKELESLGYQLYQEQIEKQQILEANEKLKALSTEYNKLSGQKDTLFTIIELMLNKN